MPLVKMYGHTYSYMSVSNKMFVKTFGHSNTPISVSTKIYSRYLATLIYRGLLVTRDFCQDIWPISVVDICQ